MSLSKFQTTDLIKELIARKISAHDYQLIYSNHIKESLRKYNERQRMRKSRGEL